MSEKFPLHFTLEDGVHVVINKTGEKTYDFLLKPEEGAERHFTFVDDESSSREEVEEGYDFDQLNAIRRFWLETEG